MSEYKAESALLEYVNRANEMYNALRVNIIKAKNGVAVIDDKTIIAMNNFLIAANALKDLHNELIKATAKYN